MATTIRDIAERAAVSPATVSLVLNNKPGVGQETRALVLKIADELNYDSSGIRSKKNGKTIRLLKIARHGHIVNRDHNVFISDYIDGIEQEARLHGYTLEVQSYNSLNHNTLMRDMEQADVAGVVILATELNIEDIPPFQDLKMPLVFIDGTHPVAPFDFIDMDNEGAVFSIVEALIKRGHTKLGLVKSSMETRNFKSRKDSFYEALRYFDLEIREDWIFSVDSTYDQSFLDMEKILANSPPLPTALFCVCDIIAFGCMKALKNKGLTIPGDVSLVGFDDLPSSAMTEPPLTSIKVSKSRIGRRAFQLLKRRIDATESLPYEKVYIGSELIVRDSLGFPGN